jgi:hypothetical protein
VHFLIYYSRKPFLIYDFATTSVRISLYMRKILLFFLSVYSGLFQYYPSTAVHTIYIDYIQAESTLYTCDYTTYIKRTASQDFSKFRFHVPLIIDFLSFVFRSRDNAYFGVVINVVDPRWFQCGSGSSLLFTSMRLRIQGAKQRVSMRIRILDPAVNQI